MDLFRFPPQSLASTPSYTSTSSSILKTFVNCTRHCNDLSGRDLPTMAMELPRILVIGALEYIGRHIAMASVELGHPTFVLLTFLDSPHYEKKKVIESFRERGIHLLKGNIFDNKSLEEAISVVDVVISTVGDFFVSEQIRILRAIRKKGHHISVWN